MCPLKTQIFTLQYVPNINFKMMSLKTPSHTVGKKLSHNSTPLSQHNRKWACVWQTQEPALVAKSSILLDMKPWDDETDMAKLEKCVRSIQADGLVWGSSKLVLVWYGIKKLQIQCVVEDDKVGTDMLEEQITAFDEYVQSMDVAAFNKI